MQDHFLGRQHFCSVCKVQVPFDRSSIAQHERTQKHERNKERESNVKRNKNIQNRIEEQRKAPFIRGEKREFSGRAP